MTQHTTITDLQDREITPALGEYADDFDIDAITEDLRDQDLITYDGEHFALEATPDEFWAIVAQHDTAN